jgi:hypothetical protein
MYLGESPLVIKLMDMAFEINRNELDIKEIDEIENYVCQKIPIKINNEELSKVIFRGDNQ